MIEAEGEGGIRVDHRKHRRVDGLLGRSYLVGFGSRPFNSPHHRGAYGAWAGFHHLIPDKPEYRPDSSRNILFGALIGGPDHNDVFICEGARIAKEESDGKGGKEWVTYYKVPGHTEPVSKKAYRPASPDEAVQLVADAKLNEVALDYNAGITASLAMLAALGYSSGKALPDSAFPPRVERNEKENLITTDREFFAAARDAGSAQGCAIVAVQLYNRSRWPARVTNQTSFRYFFALDGATTAHSIKATLEKGTDAGAVLGTVQQLKDKVCYIDVAFPDVNIFPGNRDKNDDRRTAVLKLQGPEWDAVNDWSTKVLGTEWRLMPQIPVYNARKLLGGSEP
ncbi:MAG: glycoside hydrolase family 9 protein [Planctomycetota bacterium]|nr:glycoside hydrolase family 9 protein [Planctomycetota bacterium]